MGAETKIEWTDHTFNPWIGCQRVSAGCDNCYAEAMNTVWKWNGGTWGPRSPRKVTSEQNWKKPFAWDRQAREVGSRRRVFCASLADVFDNKSPEGARKRLFQMIRSTSALDWLLLTKRPENIRKMLPDDWGDGYDNVWLGTTAENQEWYDRRWPILRKVPAKIRFISYEPALGPLNLRGWGGRPDWVICGGESGASARYMEPQWAYDLRDQCQRLDVAYFFKQMTGGKKVPIPNDLLVREFPDPDRRLAA
jgi:protein gp37